MEKNDDGFKRDTQKNMGHLRCIPWSCVFQQYASLSVFTGLVFSVSLRLL